MLFIRAKVTRCDRVAAPLSPRRLAKQIGQIGDGGRDCSRFIFSHEMAGVSNLRREVDICHSETVGVCHSETVGVANDVRLIAINAPSAAPRRVTMPRISDTAMNVAAKCVRSWLVRPH
jgi:hypothetical protein